MDLKLTPIDYNSLNAKQKENFNYQKISAVLADYGFMTLRLSDDWRGADFIAQHIDGEVFIKIQLKGRLMFSKKYCGKDLFMVFQEDGIWYLFPHDQVLDIFISETNVGNTKSWRDRGEYHFPSLSKQAKKLLDPYRICPCNR
ncbi:MAG: hypothetical protein AXA67_00130 [Methylothermaceae bacteria B42]|nr:MAG: hypothetical protein AXA67_00130 [Methylothermaceae bacteria B42]HHJ38877.1 hypothetical protein [Methylothermaceae bacterium]